MAGEDADQSRREGLAFKASQESKTITYACGRCLDAQAFPLQAVVTRTIKGKDREKLF